jgi:CheY-like chemotaxis protein
MVVFSAEASTIATFFDEDRLADRRGQDTASFPGPMVAPGGWMVLEADDGATGLAIAVEQKPALILCDLQAPATTASNSAAFLRAKPEKLPGTSIVVTASGGYGVDRETALQAGADECIVKPILQSDLLRLLQNHPSVDSIIRRTYPPTPTERRTEFPPLPASAIPEGQVVVRFWGVRGSIATPGAATLRYGGNTACVEVRADGQLIIAGRRHGHPPAGTEPGRGVQGRAVIVDAADFAYALGPYPGFPFLRRRLQPGEPPAHPGLRRGARRIAGRSSSQMESPYFPVGWQQLPSHITLQELKQPEFNIGPIRVETMNLNHPGICVGYRLHTSAGIIAYLPDNEPFQRYKYHADPKAMSRLDRNPRIRPPHGPEAHRFHPRRRGAHH